MKIALAQLNYTIGDIEGNTAKIIDAVEKAEKEDADLVLFAEYAVSGTPAYDLLRKSTFLTLCEEALERIAKYCHRVTAIVGSPLLTNRGTVSAAAVAVLQAMTMIFTSWASSQRPACSANERTSSSVRVP